MLFNTVIGFILPWIIAIIFLPSKEILFLIAPISSAIAFTINTLGFYFFWDLRPIFPREQSISRLPSDLGAYPIISCFLIFFIINYQQVNAFIIILVFSAFTTVAELALVKLNIVIYRNGWNGYFTFLSYLVAYILVYGYYFTLQRFNVITP